MRVGEIDVFSHHHLIGTTIFVYLCRNAIGFVYLYISAIFIV